MLRTLSSFLFFLSFWSLVSAVAIPVVAPVKRATICNGHESLCDRPYSDVTYIGSHDSFAYSPNPWAISRDQVVDVPTQLSLGVRLLQAQGRVNRWNGNMHFCHTSCLLFDGGSVVDYLRTVKSWLDKNPSEVLTLIFTNPERMHVRDVWQPLFDEAGISDMAYVPPSMPLHYNSWPTLGEMIESGKRVVVFMDKEAESYEVPFILPQFQMVWETPYSVTDPTFPCSVDRIAGEVSGPVPTERHMYMINHSLNQNILPIGKGIIIPDVGRAENTNSVRSILDHVEGCAPFGANRRPTYVLLDWVHSGEAFHAAKILNGLL
jgi:hypothetical protein